MMGNLTTAGWKYESEFHFLQLLMLKRSSFPLCLSRDNQKNGWAPSSTPHTYLFLVQSEALKLQSFFFFFLPAVSLIFCPAHYGGSSCHWPAIYS